MALAARVTEVGAARGMGQGALAGDRQNLHALIKVVGPTLYGYLFGLGAELGVPALTIHVGGPPSDSATPRVRYVL